MTGTACFVRHFDMVPEDPSSWLYLEHGQGYGTLDATVMVSQKLGGIWRGLAACAMPDPDVQSRLLR